MNFVRIRQVLQQPQAIVTVSGLLGVLVGFFSVNPNPSKSAMSWITLIMLAGYLCYMQVRTSIPMVLSLVGAFFVFCGSRIAAYMGQLVFTNEGIGFRIMAVIASLLGMVISVIGIAAHFRKHRAITAIFWTSIIFLVSMGYQFLKQVFLGDIDLTTVYYLANSLLWSGLVWFSGYLTRKPQKLEIPSGGRNEPSVDLIR